MFEEQEEVHLKPENRTRPAPFKWGSLPVEVLIQYYDEIRQHLPPLRLKDMNLEEEMLLQLHNIRALQTVVLNDEEIALSQRATLAKAVSDSLTKLADIQNSIWTSERFKRIEALLIRALIKLPEPTVEQFLADYRVFLAETERK